jgi:hypothetical protein
MTTLQRAAKKSQPPDLSGRSVAFFGTFAYWPSYHPGPPDEVARRRGALVRDTVDEALDYLVLGDRRGTGRAEAKKKAERLQARAKQEGKKGKAPLRPEILDEAAFREMVRLDVRGKRFAFFGGFDCCPAGFEDGLLTRMVEAVGGVVQADVDESLNYLVLGNRRGPGKITARNRAEELRAAGSEVETLDEEGFLELVRTEQPPKKKSMDFAAFITQLYGTVDQGKLGRALAMLKDESFKLYTHLSDDRLVGVVRSQTGVGTVYASWLTPEGRYGCSTPELSDCMGLQGSPCKHLLVLLVGLVRTGQMNPATAYAWIKAAQVKGPKTDTELAAETFLQYRGAQAGEIDWRPTETIPEDFYAF